MYKQIRFITRFLNILLLFLCINSVNKSEGLFEQMPLLTSENLTECSYIITSTVTSTIYLTSVITSTVAMTPLPDKSLIENPSPTLSSLTTFSSLKVNTKPKLFNIAFIIGSLLTGCIINAIGFLMYKKKRGFMVELYLCTVVMVIMMVAMCVEEILFEFINIIM